MNDFQTKVLYGFAKGGKVKQWQAVTNGAELTVLSGFVGGKIKKSTTTSVAMNEGKSNATTPAEQAILEAESKFRKKLKEDHAENVEDLVASTLPNLAQKMQGNEKHIDFEGGVSALIKLDGLRVTMFYQNGAVFFQTRGGEAYPIIKEIADSVNKHYLQSRTGVFVDGEMWAPSLHLEQIQKATKKHNKNTPLLEFWVFDYINTNEAPLSFLERYHIYKTIDVSIPLEEGGRLNAVKRHSVTDLEQIWELHDKWVAEGHEGLILRNHNAFYEFGHRTYGIIKLKVRLDAEYKVSHMSVDKHGGAIPHFYVDKITDGVTVKTTFKAPFTGFTKDECREIWDAYAANKEVLTEEQKWGKVEFESLSMYNVPTKTKCAGFRKCDSEGSPLE